MRYLIIFFISIALLGCNKKKFFDGPNSYYDDFDSYSLIEDIIDGENLNWSFFQNTIDGNSVKIDTVIFHSGTQSVKCIAAGSGNSVSKASINKQYMAFWAGDIIFVDVWYYIVGKNKIDWLFIFDLEEKASISLGPGIRLAIVDNQVLVEHKMPNPNIEQIGIGIPFPRDQWVNIQFEAKLSQKKKGYIKVWQDGMLIIEQDQWKTLPKDMLYGVQGTKGGFSQIEFGATANSSKFPIEIYVDDVDVKVLN